jgi:hypothetical protein
MRVCFKERVPDRDRVWEPGEIAELPDNEARAVINANLACLSMEPPRVKAIPKPKKKRLFKPPPVEDLDPRVVEEDLL